MSIHGRKGGGICSLRPNNMALSPEDKADVKRVLGKKTAGAVSRATRDGINHESIRRDQKAIDALPNRGLASVNHGAKNKAMHAKMDKPTRRIVTDASGGKAELIIHPGGAPIRNKYKSILDGGRPWRRKGWSD